MIPNKIQNSTFQEKALINTLQAVESSLGVSEMAHWVKVFAVKSDV